MDKVLLTGASGFLGSHLAELLVEKGYELYCTLRKTSNTQFIGHLKYTPIHIDWDAEDIDPQLFEMDYIIHCAGVTTALTYNHYFKGNVDTTLKLIEASEKAKIKRFIFISSQAVAGPSPDSTPINEEANCHPLTDYGTTKYIAEQELLYVKDQFPVTIIRPCPIYGPRDHEFLPMFNLVKKGFKVLIGNGKKQINMIHVEDLSKLIVEAMSKGHESGSIFFATDGQQYDWKQLYHYAEEAWGKTVFAVYLPLFIPGIIGKINDLISKITRKPALLNSQKVREMKPDYWLCDPKKAFEAFNFKPGYTLEEGFKSTLLWYQKQGWL